MSLRDERGTVLPIALILMTLCLLMGATMLNTVDVQQRDSGRSNQREAALTIAEGVLEAQAFVLSSSWSQTATSPFATCTSAGTQTSSCPNHVSLSSTFPSTDYAGATWTSDVFDNSSTDGGNAMQSFYSDALAATAPRYDANGDNQVWVKATATFHGKTRRLVALVKRQLNPAESFPFNTITARDPDQQQQRQQGDRAAAVLDRRGRTGAPALQRELVVPRRGQGHADLAVGPGVHRLHGRQRPRRRGDRPRCGRRPRPTAPTTPRVRPR